MVDCQQGGLDCTVYHFGSMSEGTTTPGMNSDTDTLITDNDMNIMYTLEDWDRGKINYLMVRDRTTLAQHYMLQVFHPDFPLPVTHSNFPFHVTDEHGRVFLSNRIVIDLHAEHLGDLHLRRGPSNSNHKDFDFVYAFRCNTLPPEILSWFNRPRPVNWIPPDVMEAARRCPCFLVADGHHASEKKDIEWRITPNRIERLLMFSLNIIQVQCLVVLKMTKKQELVKYIRHERCKITTFHFKTVLFFTLERTPPEMLTKPRLLECIVKCLETLKDFLSRGECPHYIVERVDLFDGKLCRECQVCLEEAISDMIQDDMHVVFHLESDDLSQRMIELSNGEHYGPRENVNARICGKLVHDVFVQLHLYRLLNICIKLSSGVEADFETRLDNKINNLHFLTSEERADPRAQYFIRFLIMNLVSIKASVVSSLSIQTGRNIPLDVWTMYGKSLHTDVTSGKLKLVSMLYCRGELWRAASLLNEVEFDFDHSVQPVCGCERVPPNTELSEAFCEFMLENENPKMWTKKLAFCVRFLREEKFCAPLFLWYEMCDVEDDVYTRNSSERKWVNWFEVDSRPFLLYLQFLTFRGLGVRHRQLEAFAGLQYIMRSDERKHLYHPETFANLLAHCHELEGDVLLALTVYRDSQCYMPRNNAANHHIARLERQSSNVV